ncbi:MAG TPA: hypothetical protein VIG47_10605 [Gemmatimonadaceae bacterium]|jgi:hypothetical protein
MILWEGASQIDGKPIVAIATDGSSNVKTGDMIQVWIIRSDIAPHTATQTGDDRSVCGDCPQRHYLGGACYVTPFQAPLSVYKMLKRGGYADDKRNARLARKLREQPIRLGAYGDPAAVPFHVWEELLAQGCGKWTGYTHQWRKRYAAPYRQILMASCDSEDEAIEARVRGWRFFLVTAESAESPTLGRTVECLSDAQGMTCEECRICDGTRADLHPNAASVAIQVHGARKARFLTVLR